jgi:hypothetical protein
MATAPTSPHQSTWGIAPTMAARILGLHLNTLRFCLQKLGITHARRRL